MMYHVIVDRETVFVFKVASYEKALALFEAICDAASATTVVTLWNGDPDKGGECLRES